MGADTHVDRGRPPSSLLSADLRRRPATLRCMRGSASRRSLASYDERWLVLFVAARLAATAFAAALLVWSGLDTVDLLLLLYGPASTLLFVVVPDLRRSRWAWAADSVIVLGLILALGDWRSPFYLLWLSTLALPGRRAAAATSALARAGGAARLPRRRVPRRPSPGRPPGRRPLETFGHPPVAAVPARRVAGLRRRRRAAPRRRAAEARASCDRGRAPADRLGAARLGQAATERSAPLVSSLQGRVDRRRAAHRAARGDRARVGGAPTWTRASPSCVRRSRAARSTRRSAERAPRARRRRAQPRSTYRESAPPLPPLVARAPVPRSAARRSRTRCAMPTRRRSTVTLERRGTGPPAARRRRRHEGCPRIAVTARNGLLAMENRAATIGATLGIAAAPTGAARAIELDVPTTTNGG